MGKEPDAETPEPKPPERIARLIGELDTETQKAAMLQQRVDRF